jgi:hypothetical protein
MFHSSAALSAPPPHGRFTEWMITVATGKFIPWARVVVAAT